MSWIAVVYGIQLIPVTLTEVRCGKICGKGEHNSEKRRGEVCAGVYLDTLGAVYDVIWPKRESRGQTKQAMAAPSRACWSAISASNLP